MIMSYKQLGNNHILPGEPKMSSKKKVTLTSNEQSRKYNSLNLHGSLFRNKNTVNIQFTSLSLNNVNNRLNCILQHFKYCNISNVTTCHNVTFKMLQYSIIIYLTA